MITLELAEKLKVAGLKWEFVFGSPRHCVYHKGKINDVDGPGAGDTMRLSPWQNYVKQEYITFAPSLSQLLAEIEAQGYEWEAGVSYVNGGPMMPGRQKSGYWCEVWKDGNFVSYGSQDTPEEAAGQALLYILEQEGKQ